MALPCASCEARGPRAPRLCPGCSGRPPRPAAPACLPLAARPSAERLRPVTSGPGQSGVKWAPAPLSGLLWLPALSVSGWTCCGMAGNAWVSRRPGRINRVLPRFPTRGRPGGQVSASGAAPRPSPRPSPRTQWSPVPCAPRQPVRGAVTPSGAPPGRWPRDAGPGGVQNGPAAPDLALLSASGMLGRRRRQNIEAQLLGSLAPVGASARIRPGQVLDPPGEVCRARQRGRPAGPTPSHARRTPCGVPWLPGLETPPSPTRALQADRLRGPGAHAPEARAPRPHG